MFLKRFVDFVQNYRLSSALSELRTTAQRAEQLAFKAAVAGADVQRECRLLERKHPLESLNNDAFAKLLTEPFPWFNQVELTNYYFSSSFEDLVRLIAPWKLNVFERSEQDFVRLRSKLLDSFVRTCHARISYLNGLVEYFHFEKSLVRYWFECEPTFLLEESRPEPKTIEYRGNQLPVVSLDEMFSLSAQVSYYVAAIQTLRSRVEKSLDSAATSNSDTGGGNKTVASFRVKLSSFSWSAEEQYAKQVIGLAFRLPYKFRRFTDYEVNLGRLTKEEYSQLLAARNNVATSLFHCFDYCIEAHKGQMASTLRLIDLVRQLIIK